MSDEDSKLKDLREKVAEHAERSKTFGSHDSAAMSRAYAYVVEWIDELLPPPPCLPCPFCGCTNVDISAMPTMPGVYAGACMNPPCSTLGPLRKWPGEAREAWNIRAANAAPFLCGIVSMSGPNGEPLACAYPPGHEGPHSWATLPTWDRRTATPIERH